MSDEKNHIVSVEKAVRLIAELKKEARQTPSQLSRTLGISRTAAYRLLWTLEKLNAVIANDNSEYSLGPFFMDFGYDMEKSVVDLSLPSMMRLRNETKETVGLYFARAAEVVGGEILESPYELRRVTRVGDSLPLTRGATGKCYLAWRLLEIQNPEQFLDSIGIEKADVQSWYNQLQTIRDTGYSVSWEERVPGSAAISAPIRDKGGRLRALITLSGPIGRITPQNFKETSKLVCSAAKDIEQQLRMC